MNIRLLLAYDGTRYHGFQVQSPEKEPTVQGILEEAVYRLAKERVRLSSAGRTDAGVHALGQVVNFRIERPLPSEAWVPALNAVLPTDIRVLEASYAPEEFHARYSAIRKTYRYLIQNGPRQAVLWGKYAWWVPYRLDLDAMREAAGYFAGEHDFSSFRASGASTKTTVRRLEPADWRVIPLGQGDVLDPAYGPVQAGESPYGQLVAVEFTGDGFLYQMVRIMVGTLVEVGRGRISPQGVRDILEGKDRRLAGPTAPPQGLALVRVVYDEDS